MKFSRLALLTVLSLSALSVQATTFSARFLDDPDGASVDLSSFSRDGGIAPGNYLLDVFMNDRLIRNRYLVSAVTVPDGQTLFCITPELLDMLALKKDAVRRFSIISGADGGQCHNLNTPQSKLVYSPDNQTLDITLPQAWMQYQDPDWIPPARWSEGVNSLVLDYNLMASRYMPHQGNASDSYSFYGTAGVNIGAWRLRSDYQYSRYDSGNGNAQSDFWLPQTYLFRPLPSLRSKLTLGQTYLSSAIFDSFRFAGITLASDERMLPPSLQGYAPQISGIANSNAQVTVSQNGRVLYQTRVSPGPFILPDLSQNISGNLDVSVRESNGTVHTWQVNTASVPFMARQGQVRYKVAAGRPLYGGRHNNNTARPDFLSGEATWGAFNNTSLYGGAIASTGDYQALALGAGQNMGLLGAIAADVTRSDVRLPQGKHQTGYSYRVNYAKTFDSTGSTLAFVGYRFSDRHFISLQEYLDRIAINGGRFQDEKQSYTVSWNQYIHAIGTGLSLSVSRLSYWNAADNNNWTLSLSKTTDIGPMHNVGLTLSLSRNQSAGWKSQNQIYTTVSIPLGDTRQLTWNYQQDNNGSLSQSIGYNDFSDPDTTWNLSAGAQRGDGAGQNLSGSIQSYTPYGQAGADVTLQSGQYRSLGLNWYGSFTATAYGAAFSQPVPGNIPRMMVDTGGVPGVSFSNGSGITNRFGIAVVSGGDSYQESDIAVDMDTLPADVDVSSAVVSQVLTEGAVGYRKLAADRGLQLLGYIRLPDGKSPPLGATVSTGSSGNIPGMVGDNGLVYLTGLSPDNHRPLTVSWRGKAQCRLVLPDVITMTHGPLLLPCR
ncbi:fimbrial biogenesis outer membrane usher protein [Salmonella enterica]|nr:fimbrial biogenesis outer membrane usher protein [Salmonella enterica]ECH9303476.1 fimbrial biogenesis outer membrane usher protein [Salmonella enterica subsp. enterica serovar Sandiego]EEE0505212.1 fimbria/pilus outer membrane usher protein [Salmonella enterica subsp. enterica serovar Braenderup]EBH7209109.1 fimbrial biogenesis outer membrane usher protein [Salmonella enterica]EBJ4345651.1 fimbrial biogenesis outer membrane usher protein [Salmonella enterica]